MEQDPTSFCSYEEFQAGAAALKEFCLLRAKSISGQLEGTIPSTSAGQAVDSSALIDGSQVNISVMGSMRNGANGPGQGGFPIRMQAPGTETTDGDTGDSSDLPKNDAVRTDEQREKVPSQDMVGENAPSISDWIVTGICAMVLLAAIAVVLLYQRKG